MALDAVQLTSFLSVGAVIGVVLMIIAALELGIVPIRNFLMTILQRASGCEEEVVNNVVINSVGLLKISKIPVFISCYVDQCSISHQFHLAPSVVFLQCGISFFWCHWLS